MDIPSRATVLSFGPSRGLALACLGGGAILTVIAIVATDAGGRLLIGLAAAVLLALGGYDTVVTPRLVASADGLRIRTAGTRATLAWTSVTSMRFDQRPRLGLSSRSLEIDAGDTLIVLGRHSLGREPREVYDLIRAVRGPDGPTGYPSTDVR